ncbi:MAG: GreA/GreB family elongation factor [Kiritimatiellia bacterium]|jgi:transcription elongation GreA/GreB family factor
MPATESASPTSIDAIEQKFLCLDGGDSAASLPDVGELLGCLTALNDWQALESRDQCYLVFQQHLVDTHDVDSLVRLLRLRAEWLGDAPAYRDECRDVLAASTRDRLALAKIESVMTSDDRPSIVLKRLELLNALVPGAACVDKTWGHGVVKSLDDFYKRIVVDFDRKPNHSMSMAYAAQSLKLVDASHILAVRHADRAAFDQMCREKPGEVVLMAVRSFGPMTAAQLQNEMENGILPDGLEWKAFWSAARRQLKGHPGIRIPAASKKAELVELSEGAVVSGPDDQVQQIAALNDVPALMAAMNELSRTLAPGSFTEDQRAILADRLCFVLKATATTHSDNDKVRALLLALSYGFTTLPVAMRSRQEEEFAMAGNDEVDLLGTLCKPDIVLNAAAKLSPAIIDDIVKAIPVDRDPEVGVDLAAVLNDMPYGLLESLLPKALADESVSKAAFLAKMADLIHDVSPSYAIILWICRNQQNPDVAALATSSALATKALLCLEPEVMGETLRLQHQIAKMFRDEKWIKGQMKRMTEVERSAFYERIHAMEGAWEPMHKRAIEKAILRNFPSVAESSSVAPLQPEAAHEIPLTSFRSLEDRKERYRVLVEETMPQNVQDIETARGYGDLRENFEYQTAKDQQRMLQQQQATLAREIQEMKGTDFSTLVFTGKVALGTEVSLTFPDGHGETYNILGDWDSDLALGIISRSSRLAQSLMGHVVGDQVTIPGEDEGLAVQVRIASVQPLSRAVLEWAIGH